MPRACEEHDRMAGCARHVPGVGLGASRGKRDTMSPELIAILAVGVSVLAFLGRLRVRLTAIEKETVRLSGLLEGLGLAGRLLPGERSQ